MAKKRKRRYRVLSFSGGILPGSFGSRKKAQEMRRTLNNWRTTTKVIEGKAE